MFIRFLSITFLLLSFARAETFIAKDGKAEAEIVVSETPQRTTRLAAKELQDYVKKITGAELKIVTEPTGGSLARIFVGQSPHTEKLGVTTEGLENGAYRIVSGENWLALIGDDTDFTPIEPWPRSNADIASGKMQAAWDKITGENWGYPHSQLHKHYSGRNSLFGTPDEELFSKDGNVNVWTYDERGSFNAVCGFLRDLGVRWYMPGEVGEILPETKTITIPEIDKTVTPDFPMRILNFRAAVYGHDAMMWGFRLGLRQPYGRQAAHGLDRMTHNEKTLKTKPEWFALYGGKRHTEFGKRLNQLCYSNDELFRNAVRFARTQFDHFDMDVVSIMPPDGYTAMCQCELCEGKDQPERGSRGALSNYVWEFVNRVAKEVAKTHPDKLISNCAYGIYTQPPTNIEKLEPNVQVIIVGGRRPTRDKPEERAELRALRDGWAKLTDRPVEIFENYPFTGRGFYLPAYIPKVMGESINETKGSSRGEDIWLTMDFGENAIGYNHFLIYFTARMYWGGPEKDPAGLFDEYCEKFYSPAADEMKQFFSFCEDNWREMETDGEKAGKALELFASAKAAADEDTVFGERIALVDNFLNGLRRKATQLSQKRGPVPKLRLVGGEALQPIVVDGNLDDKAWREIAVASTGSMRELQTGRQPIFGTSIKSAWQRGSLHFAIRCEEDPNSPPNIATTKNGDQAIWYGDVIEFLLNTDSHNYYQIAVNPAGAIINLDRGAERSKWTNWDSQAEVATQVHDDHWTVEIRIPITSDENDPLHLVIGRKPTQSLPWHINVCRQRIRDDGTELSAFSPTGTSGFHKPMKFAHFYGGNSHQFEADDSVTDYLIESARIDKLMRSRKYDEAQKAWGELAQYKKLTDLQKSEALSKAAFCARATQNFDEAAGFIEQIPIDSVAKTATMETLLAQRDWQGLVDRFGSEEFSTWPFWQRGAGAFARGRANAILKKGKDAEADFQIAAKFTSDSRILTTIFAAMGSNREVSLNDDERALEAYRKNFESRKSIGGADEFRSVQNAARILSRQGKFEEASKTLDKIAVEKLNGHWKHTTLIVRGEILKTHGKPDAAAKVLKQVVADETASKSHREQASGMLEK